MKAIQILICVGLAVGAAFGQVVFEGYMVDAKRPLFVLSDGERKSTWITIGQSFADSRIIAFDPKSEILTVEKNGARQDLYLREARVRSEDLKTRIRSLNGLKLAYEIAASGDELMVSMLRRYQAVLADVQNKRQPPTAVDFMNAQVTVHAEKKKAEIFGEK